MKKLLTLLFMSTWYFAYGQLDGIVKYSDIQNDDNKVLYFCSDCTTGFDQTPLVGSSPNETYLPDCDDTEEYGSYISWYVAENNTTVTPRTTKRLTIIDSGGKETHYTGQMELSIPAAAIGTIGMTVQNHSSISDFRACSFCPCGTVSIPENREFEIRIEPVYTLQEVIEICAGEGTIDLKDYASFSDGLTFLSTDLALQDQRYVELSGLAPGEYTIHAFKNYHNGIPYARSIQKTTLLRVREPLKITTSAKEICKGQSVSLNPSVTGESTLRYSWLPIEGLDDPNIKNPTATPVENTVYSLTVTDEKGCIATGSVAVEVNPLPAADAVPDKVLCKGSSVSLEVTTDAVNASFSWSPATGLSNSTLKDPVASPSSTTSYAVTITDEKGCSSSDEVFVTVNPLPEVSAGSNKTLCAGGSVILEGVAVGTGPFSYQWQPLEGLSATNIPQPLAHPAGTTVYTLTARDGNGCEATSNVQVLVNENPVVTFAEAPEICPGTSTVLAPEVSGGKFPYSYLWDGSETLDDVTAENPEADPVKDTYYGVTVTDASGCTASGETEVRVRENPEIRIAADGYFKDTISTCAGEAIQLKATGGTTYRWSPSSGLNNPYIEDPVAAPHESTVYTVTAVDENGCSATKTIAIHPVTAPFVYAGPNLYLCHNDPPYDLRQDVDISGGTFSGEGVDGVFFNPSSVSANVYTITYEISAGGCRGIATRQVQVFDNPVTSISEEQEICAGDAAELEAGGGAEYRWSPAEGLNITDQPKVVASPAATTAYDVEITDLHGCTAREQVLVKVDKPVANAGVNQQLCQGESIQLNGSGGETYSWSPSESLNDEGIRNPVASPDTTTLYNLTVTNAKGCTGKDEVLVTVNDLPEPDAGSVLTLCQRDMPYDLRQDVNLQGGIFSGPYVEGVLFQNAPPGIYFINYILENNGCTGTAQREVRVSETPEASVEEDEVSICKGGKVQLIANGGVRYEWFPNIGLDDPASAITYASPEVSTRYTVRIYNERGCYTERQVMVQVEEAVVSAGPDVTTCTGNSVQLNATGGDTYRWYPVTGLSNPNIPNPVASPLETTTYRVTVTDAAGCTGEDEVMVTIDPAPEISAGSLLSLCSNSEPYDLRQDVTMSGGSFSGPGVDGVMLKPKSLTPGIYFITYEVQGGSCTLKAQREVQVFDNPVTSISKEKEICAGDAVELEAGGGAEYRWSPAEGLNVTDQPKVIASPAATTAYDVEITNLHGCTAREQVLVKVDKPVANAGVNQKLCRGESIQLNGSGGETYSWSPSESLNDGGIYNPIASPDTTTLYNLTVTDTKGCTGKDEVLVTVNDLSEPDAGPVLTLCQRDMPYDLRQDVNLQGGIFSGPYVEGVLFQNAPPGIYFINYTLENNGCTATAQREVRVSEAPEASVEEDEVRICKGEKAELIVNGGGRYEWFPETSLENPASAITYASPEVSTRYTVRVYNEKGCYSERQVMVRVEEAVVSAGPDVTTCAENSVQLNATGGDTYRWYPVTGLSNPNIPNPVASPVETTTYRVTITDAAGCTGEDEVTVTINPTPKISAGPLLSLCTNSEPYDLRQDVTMSGGSFSGPGVDGVMLKPEGLKPGIYLITYEVQDGSCTLKTQREVRINDIPGAGILETDATICSGGSVRLHAFGGDSYRWSPVTGLDDPYAASVTASPSEETRYTVTVTNSAMCISEASVVVKVDQLSVDAGSDIILCWNAPPQALRSPVEGGIWEGPGIHNNILDPGSAGRESFTARLTVINDTGCFATDSITITLKDEPVVNTGPSLSICSTDPPVNLADGVSHKGGTFSGTGVTGNYFDPAVGAGNFIITYTLSYNGCEIKSYRHITVPERVVPDFGYPREICEAAAPYNLMKDISISGGTITGAGVEGGYFYPDRAGTGSHLLTYTYEDVNGCFSTATKRMDVVPEQAIDAGQDQFICNTVGALDLTLLADPAGGIFRGTLVEGDYFDATGLEAGIYTIDYYYDNGNGCISRDTLNIHVMESPLKNFGSDTLLCIGSPPFPLNHDPVFEGGEWTGTGIVENNFISSLAGEGKHILTYRNTGIECDAVGTKAITVVGKPPFATSEMQEAYACAGDFVELAAQLSQDAQNTSIGWYRSGDEEPFDIRFMIQYQASGKERIYYKSLNQFGCHSDQETFIQINTTNPSAKIEVSDTTPLYGRPVQFFAREVNNATSYMWEFGDGMISYEKDPWHFYYQSDTFTISLLLGSSNGCQTQLKQEDYIITGRPPGYRNPDDIITEAEEMREREYAAYEGPLKILSLYPVPLQEGLTVELAAAVGNHRFSLTNINGTEYPLAEKILKRGYNKIYMDVGTVVPGVYLLKAVGPEGFEVMRVVKWE